MEGLVKLQQFLEISQMNESEFARYIGVSSSIVSKWLNGTVRPNWKSLDIIMVKTRFQVTPNDFADIPPAMQPARKKTVAAA
jgi:DNA transposition AAA+ family ATPase